jgi:hypothetical protein
LNPALLYFDANKDGFPNQTVISIVDFGLRSDKGRLYLIDMASGAVKIYHTTHGVNSDKNKNGYPESYSNVINSGKSSLGFARTTDEYVGHYGTSVRLDGLSTTNSNMRARAVVYHPWEKTKEEDIIQAMSHGCITVDPKFAPEVIERVKGGSLLYVGSSTRKEIL